MVRKNIFFAKFHLEDHEQKQNPLAQGAQDRKENLSTTQEYVTVVVNVPQLQDWWERLQIGQKYLLTHLNRSLLFKVSSKIFQFFLYCKYTFVDTLAEPLLLHLNQTCSYVLSKMLVISLSKLHIFVQPVQSLYH